MKKNFKQDDLMPLVKMYEILFEGENAWERKYALNSALSGLSSEEDYDGNLMKLMALNMMQTITFSEISTAISARENGNINKRLRRVIVANFNQNFTILENFQLADKNIYILDDFAKSMGLENFSPEKVKELSEIVKQEFQNGEKNGQHGPYLVEFFIEPASKLINWSAVKNQYSLDGCIEICKNFDCASKSRWLWGNLMSCIWKELNKEEEDYLAEKSDHLIVLAQVIESRDFTNDELLQMCRDKKSPTIWHAAEEKLDWSLFSLEEIFAIQEEAKKDSAYILGAKRWTDIMKSRKFTNNELLQICRRNKDAEIWNAAAFLMTWLEIPLEEIKSIIQEARKDSAHINDSDHLSRQIGEKKGSEIITLINERDDWTLLKNLFVLGSNEFDFEDLLSLKKTLSGKPTGLLIIEYSDLGPEQLDQLVKNDFISWSEETIQWLKTPIMCAYVIAHFIDKDVSWNQLYYKVRGSEPRPRSWDLIKIFEIIKDKINPEHLGQLQSLARDIPWENYNPDEILAICKSAKYFPAIMMKALDEMAKNIQKQSNKK